MKPLTITGAQRPTPATVRIGRQLWRNRLVYLMALPVLLNFIIFHYIPMFGLRLAFLDYLPGTSISRAPFVGWENFQNFFNSYYFTSYTLNTVILSLMLIVVGFPLPILLALTLNEIRVPAYKRVVQTISYVPYFISSVIVVGILIMLLNPTDGSLNLLIKAFGGQPVAFLESRAHFRTIVVLMSAWQGTGFGAIVYLAAIAGVDPELHEAAVIDGAGRFARVWHITIMSILPTIVIMLILRMGAILNIGWYEVLLLQNSRNMSVSEIIQTFVYKRGIIDADYSYSTAVGLMMSVISLIMMLASNWISRRLTENEIYLF